MSKVYLVVDRYPNRAYGYTCVLEGIYDNKKSAENKVKELEKDEDYEDIQIIEADINDINDFEFPL